MKRPSAAMKRPAGAGASKKRPGIRTVGSMLGFWDEGCIQRCFAHACTCSGSKRLALVMSKVVHDTIFKDQPGDELRKFNKFTALSH